MTSIPNATLTTVKGLRDTGPIPIDQDVLVFGKSHAVDVNIYNTYVSRRQFQIRRQADVFFITDLDSANGTFLNGERLSPQCEQRLRDQDLIGLAEDQVVFRFNDLVKTVSAGLSKRRTGIRQLSMWWVGVMVVGALALAFGALILLSPSLTKWSAGATALSRVATPPVDISLATKTTAPTATTAAAAPGILDSLVQLEIIIAPRSAAKILLSPTPLGRGGYVRGRTVTIFVAPEPGWEIKEWLGPVYRVLDESAMVDMERSQSVMVVLKPETALPATTPASAATPMPTPAPSPPAPTPMPPSGGRILFSSDKDGNREIYVMNSDGSNQTRLTFEPAEDRFPDWSPDGNQIAFSSQRDGGEWQIYVMNADGTNQTRLTNNSWSDGDPDWSPDGTKIAFARHTGSWEVYIMNSDGTNPVQITSTGNGQAPSWSPDGSKIAFHSWVGGNDQSFVVDSDGLNQAQLTSGGGTRNSWPKWSPDGNRIAFGSGSGGGSEIYLMSPDGSGRVRLTNNAAHDAYADWSPDGQRIVFYSDRDGSGNKDREIYSMNADGSDQTRLTTNSAEDLDPNWGP